VSLLHLGYVEVRTRIEYMGGQTGNVRQGAGSIQGRITSSRQADPVLS